LEQTNTRNTSLSSELNSIKNDSVNLKQTVEKQQQQISQQQEEISALKSNLNGNKILNKTKIKQTTKQQNYKIESENTINSMKSDVQSKSQFAQEAKSQMLVLQNELNSIRDIQSKIESERQAWNLKLSENQDLVSKLTQELELAKQERDSKNFVLQRITKQNNEMRNSISQSETKAAHATKELDEFKQESIKREKGMKKEMLELQQKYDA